MKLFSPILAFLAVLALPAATQAAQPAGKLVVAFGDSLTAGYQLPPGQGFAPQLEAALRRHGIRAGVVNAGVSGDTTAQGRARLNWVLSGLRAKPDLVIVEFGANDMLRGLAPQQAEKNLDGILAELQRRRIPALLAGMIASPNLGADYGKRFNPIYARLAARYRVPLYPFFLEGVVGHRALHIGDNLHPNQHGVATIVRGIAPQVGRALTRP